MLSHVQLFAHQASLSLEFSRQENWSDVPFPTPEDRPNPRIAPTSPALQADSLPLATPGKPCLKVELSLITRVENMFLDLSRHLCSFIHT